jgi:pyridoxal 5'-phosphate synthase pdxT subunit
VVTPTIGVLALQGDVAEHRQCLHDLGVPTVSVRTPEELESVGGLVIPGGESTAMSLLAQRLGMLDPLIAARTSGMPMFGSCAGLIMLADTVLDGRDDQRTIGGLPIVARRNAFGRQIDSFETDLQVVGCGPEPFRAVFIRAPWVESVDDTVAILSEVTDQDGQSHPVAVRNATLLATSFHPELTGDQRIHALFVEMVRSASVGSG